MVSVGLVIESFLQADVGNSAHRVRRDLNSYSRRERAESDLVQILMTSPRAVRGDGFSGATDVHHQLLHHLARTLQDADLSDPSLENTAALLYLFLIEDASLREIADWLGHKKSDSVRQYLQTVQLLFGSWPYEPHNKHRTYFKRIAALLNGEEDCPKSVAAAVRETSRAISRATCALAPAPLHLGPVSGGQLPQASQVALAWIAASIRRGFEGYVYVAVCPLSGDVKIGSCSKLVGRWRQLTDSPHGLHVLRVVRVPRLRAKDLEAWIRSRLLELGATPNRAKWFNCGTEWVDCDLDLVDRVLDELLRRAGGRPPGIRCAFANQMKISGDRESQRALFAVLGSVG